MERYIGIDVHAASCTLAVVSERGKLLRTMVVETNGEALVDAVRGIAGRRRVVFEEGTCYRPTHMRRFGRSPVTSAEASSRIGPHAA